MGLHHFNAFKICDDLGIDNSQIAACLRFVCLKLWTNQTSGEVVADVILHDQWSILDNDDWDKRCIKYSWKSVMIHDVHRCLMLDMLDDGCCCWWWWLSGGGLGWHLKLRRWLTKGPYLLNSSGFRISIHLYFTVSCFPKVSDEPRSTSLVDFDHQVRSEKNGGFNKVISVGGNAVCGNVGDTL